MDQSEINAWDTSTDVVKRWVVFAVSLPIVYLWLAFGKSTIVFAPAAFIAWLVAS